MLSDEELIELFKLAPKESFELLLRNIRIREIIQDLFRKHRAGVKLYYNEQFDKIFEEIFRFFFRPLETAVLGMRQLEFLLPTSELMEFYETYSELMNAYLDFMRSIYDHFKLTFEIYTGRTLPATAKDFVDMFTEEYMKRIRKYTREFSGIELSTETPFLMPKIAFTRFDEALECWNKFGSAFRKFREMVREGYVKGAENFIELANKTSFESYQEFANAFFNEEAKVFDELLKSEEYLKTQEEMLNCLMDYIHNLRAFIEEILINNPLNPFATISLMDKAFERIYELRRKIKELEKRVERLEVRKDAG